MSRRCAACGSESPAASKFCIDCGAELGRVCKSCGAANVARARFCGECGAALAPGAAAEPAEAERRQLTVLFCDLVNSTEIAARLDPEDWHELSGRFQRAASSAIERFGGTVVKYLGDGILALFGYPQARDDEAERAVRAGLAILEAVAGVERELDAEGDPRGRGMERTLQMRVGMHSGPVVVAVDGDQVDVFGDTANVAARVQDFAEPGTVCISGATHRLAAGLFIVDDCGAPTLKGVAAPVPIFRVRQPSGVRGRLHATAASGLTPFVSREQERQTLRARWDAARAGKGELILISGEPGIGKSRLVQRFREDLGEQPYTWIDCAASPFHKNTPLFPLLDQLRQTLGWRADEDAAVRLERFERVLAVGGLDVNEAVPLLAPLLELPLPERYPPPLLSAEQRRQRTLALLAEWTLRVAHLQPTILVLEDLHWADATTLELQTILAERVQEAPLLLVYTARPEFRAPWPARTHHTQLVLGRLDRTQARQMVERVVRDSPLQESLADAVVRRTDGVPLFIEELTRLVLDRDPAAAERAIPETLQGSLMARLDRLGAAKEVAQVASVIGREFSYPLLTAIGPMPEEELEPALRRLVEADVLRPSSSSPHRAYSFKHALVQETAYESMLKSRRRSLHGAIATALRQRFGEIAERHPELVAHHSLESGDIEAAASSWALAAERAATRASFAEAFGHQQRALDAAATLPDNDERARLEIALLIARGQVLWAMQGYSSTEATAAFARARELGERLGDLGRLRFVLFGIWASTLSRGDLRSALALAQEMLAVAERHGTRAAGVLAHLSQGITRYYLGEVLRATQHFEQASALYDPEDHRFMPNDPGVMALCFRGLAAVYLGLPESGMRWSQEALSLARKLEKPYDAAWAEATAAAGFHVYLREPELALQGAERLLAIGAEQGLPLFRAMALIRRGWAMAELGEPQAGLTHIRQGLSEYRATGTRVALGLYLRLYAEALAHAGAVHEALATIDEALSTLPEEEVLKPDLLHTRAKLLRLEGADAALVESTLREGIAVAQRLGTLAPELRTSVGLAGFLLDHGRAEEARAVLVPVYSSMREGLQSRDMIEAREVMARL